MKNIIALLVIFLVVSACRKLEDLNKNTKDPVAVSGESLFTGAQKNLFDQMTTPNQNLNIFRLITQQWTETTYTDETRYNLANRALPDNHWNILYRDVLEDLHQAAIIINATDYLSDPSPNIKKNRLAIVEVMSVFTWSILVETFGNIPYTEALNIDITLPKYDDGLTIYKDLIIRLNKAIGDMDPAFGSMDIADNMYGGDVAQWVKFANSLKLRMGLLLSDVDPATARTAVEEAAAAGLISSNSDNAKIVYLSAQPNANQIYVNLIASGRHDFVPANTLVDTMNNLNDPRRQFYFTLYDSASASFYKGGIYGAQNDYSESSHVADKIQDPAFEAIIFDYAETEFLLAEAAERGFTVTGTAGSHYNNAIAASITYWGGTDSDVTSYLANPRVAYSTAAGDFKRKIGIQMWIALYNRGFESWTEWRKFDYPALQPPPDAFPPGAIPVRFTYPAEEQTLNGSNWSAASAAIGGDDVRTKLFWDKH